MKVLLTGASGMLAAEVVPALKRAGHEVFQTDLKPRLDSIERLDITNKDEVFKIIDKYKPEFVFHLAAETNVDLCQQKPDHAFLVNTQGTENIALACQQNNIKFLYVSTAGVFPGDKKEPYIESDKPNPANIYGESKLRGENLVKELLTEYYIVRAGWMVGGWEIDKKFVFKIVQQLKEEKKELRVVSDKKGTPAFTKDFANGLLDIINTGQYGIYHLANQGTSTRYDIAVKIVEFMGLKNEVTVKPISSDEFPLPAPRADSEMIKNDKLDNTLSNWRVLCWLTQDRQPFNLCYIQFRAFNCAQQTNR